MASFRVNAGFGIGPGARVAVLGRLVHSLSLYGAIEGLHLGAEVHLLEGGQDYDLLGWSRDEDDRLVIFTESLKTLEALS